MKDADFDPARAGQFAHDLAKTLFPICRSLTGPGVRETLKLLGEHLPLEVHAVSSGTDVMDWTVPDEWTIRGGTLEHESGERFVDFADSNLHVLGYSEPVDLWLSREDLDAHLYSLPDQPDAIPYITSYYNRRWGFCLSEQQRRTLPAGRYHAVIDSDLRPGVLNYADCVIAGDSAQEIMLSTYICHPSMANNELSGPVVMTALARWLMSLPRRRYSYRLIFIPETIGAIVYLSRNLDQLKRTVVAGFNLTCVGDDRCYSYLPSRAGDTIADRAAIQALRGIDPDFKRYSWLQRGSDERQYCAPGVDLPIASIMRSKYGEYPEYHTSLDDLTVVTPTGLQGGFEAIRAAIEILESDMTLRVTVLGEPQLGKRGLYPTLSTKSSGAEVQTLMDLISYCDGTKSLIEIGDIIGASASELAVVAQPLIDNGLLKVVTAGM
jgi:aminopeptidase-like protein